MYFSPRKKEYGATLKHSVFSSRVTACFLRLFCKGFRAEYEEKARKVLPGTLFNYFLFLVSKTRGCKCGCNPLPKIFKTLHNRTSKLCFMHDQIKFKDVVRIYIFSYLNTEAAISIQEFESWTWSWMEPVWNSSRIFFKDCLLGFSSFSLLIN